MKKATQDAKQNYNFANAKKMEQLSSGHVTNYQPQY